MSTQWTAELTLPVSLDRDHIQGPADAPLTLLEYGDYECPYCGAAYPIVKQVQSQMGDRLRFVFGLEDADLHRYAEQLGLDVRTFAEDLENGAHTERVHEDFMSGVRSGVDGTPTFYINGLRHDGGYQLESLVAALTA